MGEYVFDNFQYLYIKSNLVVIIINLANTMLIRIRAFKKKVNKLSLFGLLNSYRSTKNDVQSQNQYCVPEIYFHLTFVFQFQLCGTL